MNVVAVGAHPDDMELLCGGTLTRFAQQGAQVWLVTLSIGELGHRDIEPLKLSRIRREEATAAAAVIGASHLCLDQPAEYIQDTSEARNRLVEVLRLAQADVVLTHPPQDYHLDHMNASKVVFSATLSAPIVRIATSSSALQRHPMLFYCDALGGLEFQPSHYVDVSTTYNTKLAMLRCHQTQLKMDYWPEAPLGLLEMAEIMARFRGMQSSVTYAEGFRPALAWPRLRAGAWLP
jgi:LmbE family N-acetylglucosaminyl deacetylase